METNEAVAYSDDWKAERREKYFRDTQDRYDTLSNREFIGAKFKDIDFGTLVATDHNRDAILGAMRYFDDLETNLSAGRSIGLMGPKGTGKTALLVAFHKEFVRKQVNSLIVSAVEFFAQLKRTFDTQEHSAVIQRTKNAHVLTIDDLGRGPVNAWRNELLMEILDARWRHDRPTNFSTNMESREALAEYLQDDGIVDRLFCTTESAGKDEPQVAVYRIAGGSWR